jgi:hypothetical protein
MHNIEWMSTCKQKIEILKKNLVSFAPKFLIFSLYILLIISMSGKKFQVVISKNKKVISKNQKNRFFLSSAASVHLW